MLSGIFFAKGLDRVLGDLPLDAVHRRDQPIRRRSHRSALQFGEQTRSLRFIVNCPKNREISMNLAKMMLAGAMLVAVPSVTLAQQSLTGTVTTIDRIGGIIVIRQTPSGTVGASGGGTTDQQFRAPAALLEPVHAGDKVTISVTESGGKKTITKIDRQ